MTLPEGLSLLRQDDLPEATLSIETAVQQLGIKRDRVLEWVRRGIIWAHGASAREYRISARYLETLLIHNGRRKLDYVFAELFALHWMVQYGSGEEAWAAWAYIAQLQATGEVVDSNEAARLLGTREHNLIYWRKRGYLRWIWTRSCREAGYLASDIIVLRREMAALTVYEAADRLGTSISSVRALAATGALPSFRTPNGLQFDPAQVEVLGAERSETGAMIRSGTVRKRLGIERHVLESWAMKGALARQKHGHTYWYAEAAVEALYTELTAFGPWFEWLAAFVSTELPRSGRGWMNTARAARELGVGVNAVLRWRASELLPFCSRIPSVLKQAEYDYPEAYVLGLVGYVRRGSGGLRMHRSTLTAYREACKGEGRIV